jgi:hypothetical protein
VCFLFNIQRRLAGVRVLYQDLTGAWARPGPKSPRSTVDLSSFLIGDGSDGGRNVQLLCRNLGISGPDEFAISLTDKFMRSTRSSHASELQEARHCWAKRARPQPCCGIDLLQ